MSTLGWTDSWFVQLASQMFICLALGLWFAVRFGKNPARAHAVLVLGIAAALVAPGASWLVRQANGGLFLTAPEATAFTLALDKSNLRNRADGVPISSMPVGLWALGALALITGIALSFLRGRRLVAAAESVSDLRLLAALKAARTAVQLRAEPELRSHAVVASPMVWAFRSRPVVLIPDDAMAGMDGVDWEAIFIHELAHVQRLDHIAVLFTDLACALMFWNPVIWWARRRLARESEFACDDCVVVSGKSPADFAEALLALRRDALVPSIPATRLTGSRSWLKARVQRLLEVNDRSCSTVGTAWLTDALGVTVALVFALALAQGRHGQRPEDSFARPLAPAPSHPLAQSP
jgi:beta-lactamase regulating signal transducer with metallopeptidase domain